MSVKDILPWKASSPTQRKGKEMTEPFWPLHREMDRFFDGFFSASPVRWGRNEGRFIPSLDVVEKAGEVVVTAELPGLDEKDVDVSIDERMVTIRGEKTEEHEEKDDSFHHVERSFGSFQRHIPLSSPIDRERATASFRKGVLTIRLPKSGEAGRHSRKIKIET